MTKSRNDNLTDITSVDSFPLSRPNNNLVTYTFDTDPTRPGITQITLPPGSTWTPSPHWHERYTEYLQVLRGRVRVVLDGKSKIVTARDGPQIVDKFVVHEWMRADLGMVEKDAEEVVVEEWTDPADGTKQVFFRNLLGVITDAGRYWKGWTTLQIFIICSAYDNFEVMIPSVAPKVISYIVTHTILTVVQLLAILLGLSSWYEAYTPSRLRSVAAGTEVPQTAPNKKD